MGIDAVVDLGDVLAFSRKSEIWGRGCCWQSESFRRRRRVWPGRAGWLPRLNSIPGKPGAAWAGHPGPTGFASQGVGEDSRSAAVEADPSEFPGDGVHEDVGDVGRCDEHAVEIELA